MQDQQESNERSAEWLRGAKWAFLESGEPLAASKMSALLASAEAREAKRLTKAQWIERYGGQAVLDREGFDVVPCVDCKDLICHGWMVKRRTEPTQPTAAEVAVKA